MSLAIIEQNHDSAGPCVVMNALDIFTPLSLNTMKSLFAQGLSKATIIYDSNDQMSRDFLRSSFNDSITFTDIGLPDSDYTAF